MQTQLATVFAICSSANSPSCCQAPDPAAHTTSGERSFAASSAARATFSPGTDAGLPAGTHLEVVLPLPPVHRGAAALAAPPEWIGTPLQSQKPRQPVLHPATVLTRAHCVQPRFRYAVIRHIARATEIVGFFSYPELQ